MKWLDQLKRLWATSRKEVAEQKSVEESAAGKKEADATHNPLKKKPLAKPATKPAVKPIHKSTKIQAWQTQFDGIPENDRQTQVIIGLDFGTAFTKVVISAGGQKYGVPLNDNEQGTNKYLLPTRLYKDSERDYSIDKPKNYVSSHTDLKMRILDSSLDTDTKDRVIAYIAQVLQKSRYWLMTEKRSVIGGFRLKWAVNIGLPTERESNPELRKTYLELVGKAWYMSTKPPPEAEGDGKPNNTERPLHPDMIEAFPEFVAQIQGYISSPQRQPGIHSLVDVGAGTIDATVFIVHREDGEDIHPILSESVKPLGTTYLAEHRCEKSKQNNSWRPSPYDVFPPIDEFVQMLGLSKKEIRDQDREFRGEINNQIHSMLKKAKNDHDRVDNIVDDTSVNRQERNGIPLMLCGGGARVEFYKEVIKILMRPGFGYLLQEAPLPALADLDADSLLGEDHNRLSVAYGLSFEAANIGGISRPDPILQKQPKQGTQCLSCNGRGGANYDCPKCGGSGFLSSV